MVKSSSWQRLVGVFLQEARERTSSMERDLLCLEKGPDEQASAEHVRSILRSAHSLKGAARLVELQGIESVFHWMEELLTRSAGGTVPLGPQHIELLLRATDAVAATLPVLERGQEPLAETLDEVSAELVAASANMSGDEPGHETPKEEPKLPPRLPNESRREEKFVQKSASYPEGSELESIVRVPAARLDAMLTQSGELLLARSAAVNRVAELARLREDLRRDRHRAASPADREVELSFQLLLAGMAADCRSLRRITNNLDAEVRKARLQPFTWVCEGLERMVRDFAADSGKQVTLQIKGGEIEIDRSILEELRTALRHIVRNAVDHGIEPPGERLSAGKAGEGLVIVSARLKGDRVSISISDDGRGLETERIKSSAVRRGLNEQVSEEDVERLIFVPGVSTAETTTRISGRGVGLDAVRTCVENMRGAVQVDHTVGAGTTFTITVPLTVGTIRALLLRSAGQLFAIDSSAIRRVFRFPSDMVSASGGGRLVVRAEKPLPLLRLADWFQIGERRAEGAHNQRIAVELNELGSGTAIEIDEIVSEQEFLVRNLGPRLANIDGVSGGIVLSDGGIALILNVAALGEAAISGGVRPAVMERLSKTEKRYRVLIVDDSLTTRTLEKTILEGAGYQVSVASDGMEAWQLLERDGGDLILADVDMPGMDGFMLTEKVRQSARFRDVPVVLLTARESSEDRRRGLSVGADAYLTKSAFDQRELLSTIGQLL